jgi:hypothetical protein
MLKYAGFSHVIAEDRTDQVCPSSCVQRPCSCSFPLVVFCLDLNWFQLYSSVLCVVFQFLGILQKELDKFEKNKDGFLSDFSQVI